MDKAFEKWLKQDDLFDYYKNNPEQQQSIFEDYQKEREFIMPEDLDEWLRWMVKNPELAEKYNPILMQGLTERIKKSPPYKTARIIQDLPLHFPDWKSKAEQLFGLTKQKMIQQQIELIDAVLDYEYSHEIIQQAVEDVRLELIEEKKCWENELQEISTHETEINSMQQKTTQKSDSYSNSQMVLIFYYFLKYCGVEPRVDIDIAPIAKFMHLITGKPFTGTPNSDFYKKLQKVPNYKTEGELIRDLQFIRPMFEKVQLTEIVKMIDNEIGTARSEMKNKHT